MVRPATLHDCEAIARIYTQGIEDRIATFETRPRSALDIEQWLSSHYPVMVVEEEGEVIAFAATSTYRARDCYAGIAEYSVYVHRDHRGKGVGRLAMQALLKAAVDTGFWKLISRIFPENHASRRLMKSLGFREVGVYHRHGKLDGEWRDVVIVEELLREP